LDACRSVNPVTPLQRATPDVKQITTGTICHLDAQMVKRRWSRGPSMRLISLHRKVGNLVCPSSYDLGEELRFVLLSVTEDENKPLKTPPSSTALMLPSLQKWTWPTQPILTLRRLAAT
jgi:Ni2+-binding GTPase involved in maturation of urease and hydrogenase